MIKCTVTVIGRGFLVRFPLGLPSLISSCGFGGIRTRAPIKRLACSKSVGFFVMSENPQRDKAALDMKVARADAIHAYASLEQSLSGFLALLMQTEAKLAGVVFYRMGAVQRNKAIEILLEYRFKGQYDNYWHGTKGEPGKPGKPGLLSIVRTLDEIRNQIVHWSIAVSVGGGEPVESLIPPNIWAWVEDGRDLTIEEIREFTAKANFAHRSIMMFTLFHRPDFPAAFDEETKRTWLEIFQQPCTYPPSKEHPLGPKT